MISVLLRSVQGALIGLGAVLPGISGGVLCVVFGLYEMVMDLLAHPLRALRKHWKTLLPVLVGGAVGFLLSARVLGVLLRTWEEPAVCVFVGLILALVPGLLRSAGERGRGEWLALGLAFLLTLALLVILDLSRVRFSGGTGAWLFCGACLALSVIAPGLSFSTLLMPLGLYTPFVEGLGRVDDAVLIPGAVGALLTVALLSRAVSKLLSTHYSLTAHAIVGIVLAATLSIVPLEGFTSGLDRFLRSLLFVFLGALAALLLERLNRRVQVPQSSA